jgi:hypothetical protein
MRPPIEREIARVKMRGSLSVVIAGVVRRIDASVQFRQLCS